MAVAIRELKMQDSCYDCPFLGYEFGECFADEEKRYTEGYGNWNPAGNYPNCILKKLDVKIGKPEWCPLYEIDNE